MNDPYPTRWARTVAIPWSSGDGLAVSATVTEFLDLDAAVERYHEAMRERGDASMRDIIGHVINGKLGDLTP